VAAYGSSPQRRLRASGPSKRKRNPALRARIGHSALVWTYDDPEQFLHAIRKTGELGFRGTEVWGGVYDMLESRRDELRGLLDDSGVTLASLFHHGEWTAPDARDELVETARRWSDAVAGFGGNVLMLVPGHRQREQYDAGDFEAMADAMNECGRVARASGVRAAMHPHWGTTIETEEEIDRLLGMLDPEVVGFAPDTGQIAKGGGDPVAVARRHRERIWHVHLKDLAADWPELRGRGISLDSPEGYAELGEGVCDLRGFLDVLEDADFSGWLLAELDLSRYTPDESARINRDFLWRELGLESGSAPSAASDSPPVKCTVLYRHPDDPEAFEDHYLRIHIPLGAQLPGLRRSEFAKVVGPSDAPFYRIAELYFDSREAMERAFASPEGKRALADRESFAGGLVTQVVSELDNPKHEGS
jgi:inosose dehydratase